MPDNNLTPLTVARGVSELVEAIQNIGNEQLPLVDRTSRIDNALTRLPGADQLGVSDVRRIRDAVTELNFDPDTVSNGAAEVLAALDRVAEFLPKPQANETLVTELKEALRLGSPSMVSTALKRMPEELNLSAEQTEGIKGMLAVFEQRSQDLPAVKRETAEGAADRVRAYLGHEETTLAFKL
jgi:hypothetical protein